MLDLNNGILKIDDIEFSYDITITDFIKKFNKKLKHKPELFENKNKQLFMFIEIETYFYNILCSLIVFNFNEGKLETLVLYPSINSDDENENYKLCKELLIKNFGKPTNELERVQVEQHKLIEYKYKIMNLTLTIDNDFKDLRSETKIIIRVR